MESRPTTTVAVQVACYLSKSLLLHFPRDLWVGKLYIKLLSLSRKKLVRACAAGRGGGNIPSPFSRCGALALRAEPRDEASGQSPLAPLSGGEKWS